jgi:hypothetical protein
MVGAVLRPATSLLSQPTFRNFSLLLMATGSPFTEILNSPVLAADPTSAHVSRYKGTRSLGDVRILGDNVTLGAIPKSQARNHGKIIIQSLETAPPSVLKPPVDWSAANLPALYQYLCLQRLPPQSLA